MKLKDGTEIEIRERLESIDGPWGCYACDITLPSGRVIEGGEIQGDRYEYDPATLRDHEGNKLP